MYCTLKLWTHFDKNLLNRFATFFLNDLLSPKFCRFYSIVIFLSFWFELVKKLISSIFWNWCIKWCVHLSRINSTFNFQARYIHVYETKIWMQIEIIWRTKKFLFNITLHEIYVSMYIICEEISGPQTSTPTPLYARTPVRSKHSMFKSKFVLV